MHTACVHAYFVCVLYGYVLDLAKDSMSSTGPGRQLYDYAYQSLGRSPEHLACRTHPTNTRRHRPCVPSPVPPSRYASASKPCAPCTHLKSPCTGTGSPFVPTRAAAPADTGSTPFKDSSLDHVAERRPSYTGETSGDSQVFTGASTCSFRQARCRRARQASAR